MERKIVKHATVLSVANDVGADAEFHVGQRVRTLDGHLGRILLVTESFAIGNTEYQVVLDNGMGGGTFLASQLRPVPEAYGGGHQAPAYLPAGVTAAYITEDQAREAFRAQAADDSLEHEASADYPEMGDVLTERPDPGRQITVIGALVRPFEDTYSTEDNPAYHPGPMPRLYHGTNAELGEGHYVEPGHQTHYQGAYDGMEDEAARRVHATPHVETAWQHADNAVHEHGGRHHVYEVEPTGKTTWGDEAFPEDFESDDDMNEHATRMSESPFKVKRELPYRGERLPFTQRHQAAQYADGVDPREDEYNGAPQVGGTYWGAPAQQAFVDQELGQPQDPMEMMGLEPPPEDPAAAGLESTAMATDWAQFHDKIPGEIHRGLYAPESHGVFSMPMSDEDVAHGLIAAHQEEHFPYERDRHKLFGTHWSSDEGVARDFAHEHERNHFEDDQCPDHDEHSEATPAVFHAQRPQRHEIEDDPRRLGWQNVDDYDAHEKEVPIRHGAPVRLTGVSWLKHTGLGPMWHRHDFQEPVELRAEDRDSPEDANQWNASLHAAAGLEPTAARYLRVPGPRGEAPVAYYGNLTHVRHPADTPARLYHGTGHEASPGDPITPGHPGNYVSRMKHNYMTEDLESARSYAFKGSRAGDTPHVYEVKPTGVYGHRSDARGSEWATEDPLEVVGEAWRHHQPLPDRSWHEATTISGRPGSPGTKIDDHGDAPGHGADPDDPRAAEPNSYDDRSTEGQGDGKWDDAMSYAGMSPEEVKKRHNGAQIGMYPEAISAGGGPGIGVGGFTAATVRYKHYVPDPEGMRPGDYEDAEKEIEGPFYHGGRANLRPGGMLRPGMKTNSWGDEGPKSTHIHLTTDKGTAATYASSLSRGHVYEVEPTGDLKPGYHGDEYKSEHPLRVVRKVPPEEWGKQASFHVNPLIRQARVPWTGHERDQLRQWQEVSTASPGDWVSSHSFTNKHPLPVPEPDPEMEFAEAVGPRAFTEMTAAAGGGYHLKNQQQFYHGTATKLRVGQTLEPGGHESHHNSASHVYMTLERARADQYAFDAMKAPREWHGDYPNKPGKEQPRTYVVEATGHVEADPFDTSGKAFRTPHPVRVVKEVRHGVGISGQVEALLKHAGMAEATPSGDDLGDSLDEPDDEMDAEAPPDDDDLGSSGHQTHSDEANEVFEQLAEDFPPEVLDWVFDVEWSGPVAVPLDQVDFEDEDQWEASQQPEKVEKFREKIEKKEKKGKHPKPAILIQRPSYPALFITDGHHRALAERELEEQGEGDREEPGLWAFVAQVPEDDGPWMTMHDEQLPGGETGEEVPGEPGMEDDLAVPPPGETSFEPGADPADDYSDMGFEPQLGLPPMSQGGTPSKERAQKALAVDPMGEPAPPDEEIEDEQPDGEPGLPFDEIEGDGDDEDEGKPPPSKKEKKKALRMFTEAAGNASFRFEFTAAWRDVVAKATRINDEKGVRITAAYGSMVIGEVKGDHATYESGLQYYPGRPYSVMAYSCGCPWATFHQDADYPGRLNGRLCSHAYALSLAAKEHGIAKRMMFPDTAGWPEQVTVKSEPPWHPSDKSWARQYEAPMTKRPIMGSLDSLITDTVEPQMVMRPIPAVTAARVLLQAGEDRAAVTILLRCAGLSFEADQANAPWGSQNVIDVPPAQPYGATSPPEKDRDPGSYGPLSGPDPDNWGEIQDNSAIQMPLTSDAVLHHDPRLTQPEDEESFSYSDRAAAGGPSTAISPRDPNGLRMEETIRTADQADDDFAAAYDADVARTKSGHWHPPNVPCTGACPMGDPKSAGPFHEMVNKPHTLRARQLEQARHAALAAFTASMKRSACSFCPTCGGDLDDNGKCMDLKEFGESAHKYASIAEPQLEGALAEKKDEPEGALEGDGLTAEYDPSDLDSLLKEMGTSRKTYRESEPVAPYPAGQKADPEENPQNPWGNRRQSTYEDAKAYNLARSVPDYREDSATDTSRAQHPDQFTQQPGMGSWDDPLSPSDPSIQTVGNQQFGGGWSDSGDLAFRPDVQEHEPEQEADQVPTGQFHMTASEDDVVAQFQRSAAAGQYATDGAVSVGDSDIAAAAKAFLQKQADVLPPEEADELIREGRGTRARNLDLMDLRGTHYVDDPGLDEHDDDVIYA